MPGRMRSARGRADRAAPRTRPPATGREGAPASRRGPFTGVLRFPRARLRPQRVDIDGGGVDPPLDRDPITGPLGVVLCGVDGGGATVGFGVVVGSGWLGAGVFAGEDAAEEVGDTCESLMDPSLGRSADEVPPPCASGAPLGRSVSAGVDAPAPPEDVEALLVSGAGGWLTVLLQAAQTRAAATAVAAALAGATVPRFGMDATVAK